MTTTDDLDLQARCAACGYDLRGLVDPDRCPECGGTVTASMLAPVVASEPDAGDAIERSGLGLIAAATWCSAIPLSGLMLKPYVGGLLVVVFLFGTLARLVGWYRFRRGPLRAFDEIRFEMVARVVTFLELGLLVAILTLTFGPWPIPLVAWWILAMAAALIGGLGIVLPAVSAIRLGRRVHDPVLRGVGFGTMIATGLAVPPTLLVILMSFGLRARNASPSEGETIIYFGCMLTGLALTVIGAHLGRIAITGIQSVLLELFVERHSGRPESVRIGGAWISASDGPRPEPIDEPGDTAAIPLSPRKPPVRRNDRPGT